MVTSSVASPTSTSPAGSARQSCPLVLPQKGEASNSVAVVKGPCSMGSLVSSLVGRNSRASIVVVQVLTSPPGGRYFRLQEGAMERRVTNTSLPPLRRKTFANALPKSTLVQPAAL